MHKSYTCKLFIIYICNSYLFIMKERILEFLRSENKSSAQLAEEIGVQPSGISHILSGRNNPSLDFVLKMLEKYPYLSSDWLLFGKGTIYKEVKSQNLFDETIDMKADSIKEPVAREVFTTEKIRKPENHVITDPGKDTEVEKIVWFYANNSFREYFPGEQNK